MRKMVEQSLVLFAVLLAAIQAARPGMLALAGGEKGEDIVDAGQMTKLYGENPAEFDKKYKGKSVTIEGLVDLTGVKVGKATCLMIKSPKSGIRCEESTPDFEGIHIGHKVRIQGTVQGHSDTTVVVVLHDCKVAKVFGDDYPPSKKTKEAVRKLQGTWKVVSAEANGKDLPTKQAFTSISVEGYTAYLQNEGQSLAFGLAVLNPDKAPTMLDLVGAFKTLPSLYTLDGDKLKLALPALNKDGTFSRPADFDTTKAGSIVLNAEKQKQS